MVAVHLSGTHSFSKTDAPEIELHEGRGVVGDAHYGVTVQHLSRVRRDPSQPNLRQVHLMHAELFDELAEKGCEVGPGQLGENVTTRGVRLLELPVGTRLAIGGAVITLTGLRNPCQQINEFQNGLLKQLVFTADDGEVVRLAGVMGVVSRSGRIRPGDEIEVQLPPEPRFRLTKV